MTARLSQPVRGALWMIGAAASLTAMAVLIRLLTPQYPVLELIFLRSVVNLLLMTPWIVSVGPGAIRSARIAGHALRNAFLYVGNVAWFFGVTMVSLADLSALQFTMPLFTVVMAGLFLREAVGLHRWTATALGFAGALVILRPGFVDAGAGSLVVLAAALFYSCAYIATKRLSATESGNVVVFYMSVSILLFSMGPAIAVWKTPDPADLPAIAGLGVAGYATHFCVTRAMAAADASYVVPFDFLRLPFSAALGFVLFGERAPIWTWIGAAIVFSAAYYNTWRESAAGGAPANCRAARPRPGG